MKKVMNTIRWTIHYFIRITIAGFVLIYLRWFQLTPVMGTNDPDEAYVFGLILLGLFCFFAINLTKPSDDPAIIKMMLFILSTVFLLGNIAHAIAFFPTLSSSARCAERTYYITWMHPLTDYQWTFYNITIWKPFLTYESYFLGYSGGPYEVVCDKEKRETNIIRKFNNILVETYGEDPRVYDEYAGAILGDQQYFLSRECNDWVPSTCGSLTYKLYECDLSFRSCDSLLIQYTQFDTRNFLVLEADETTNEVILYEEDFETDDVKLIFTYGEHPRCYVGGCEILEEIK